MVAAVGITNVTPSSVRCRPPPPFIVDQKEKPTEQLQTAKNPKATNSCSVTSAKGRKTNTNSCSATSPTTRKQSHEHVLSSQNSNCVYNHKKTRRWAGGGWQRADNTGTTLRQDVSIARMSLYLSHKIFGGQKIHKRHSTDKNTKRQNTSKRDCRDDTTTNAVVIAREAADLDEKQRRVHTTHQYHTISIRTQQ